MASVGPELLGRLIDAHGRALQLYAAQWTDAAPDVVQEAFLALIRRRRLPERVRPWLFRVVRNRAINVARSERRRRERERTAAEMANLWFEPDDGLGLDAQAAAEALQSLESDQREVIVGRIWGGLTLQEVAEVVGVSTSTAYRRYEAGLAVLRERLDVTWRTTNR